MQTIYEAAGGNDGLLRLASAWHTRVLADEVVSHAFSHGFHPQHTERLAAYWAEVLGGPTKYSDACCTITLRGPPRPRCLVTSNPPSMSRTVCTSQSGPGMDS